MMIQTLIINIDSEREKNLLDKLLDLIGETSVEYKWIISNIEASGFKPSISNSSYIQLEVDSKNGIEVDINNISKFCNQFDQLIWISIIGFKKENFLDISNYEKLHTDAQYLIELVDGTYREVTTKDLKLKEKILSTFSKVKIVDWNERYKKS